MYQRGKREGCERGAHWYIEGWNQASGGEREKRGGRKSRPPLFARVLCGSAAPLAASAVPTGERDTRRPDHQPADADSCGFRRRTQDTALGALAHPRPLTGSP